MRRRRSGQTHRRPLARGSDRTAEDAPSPREVRTVRGRRLREAFRRAAAAATANSGRAGSPVAAVLLAETEGHRQRSSSIVFQRPQYLPKNYWYRLKGGVSG